MSAQLKYCFIKEKSLFFRRFIFMGIMFAIFGFALGYPLMYKAIAVLFTNLPESFKEMMGSVTAMLSFMGGASAMPSGAAISELGDMYNNGTLVYALTLTSFTSYSLLVIMLVSRSAAGGEQKKRAMMVPLCSGLKTKNYLIPKFIIYPLSALVLTFIGGVCAGFLTNALFDEGRIDGGLIFAASIFAAVYVMCMTAVYLSLGVCTQRPGLITGGVFLGEMLMQTFLEGVGLKDYHPFSLMTLVGGEMFKESFDFAEKTPSIAVSLALSVVIAVLMYFLALGVMNAKKINNQEEIKPEF